MRAAGAAARSPPDALAARPGLKVTVSEFAQRRLPWQAQALHNHVPASWSSL